MNDLSVALGQPRKHLEDVTQHLAAFAQASARTSELLTQNLTLREIASDLLNASPGAVGLDNVSTPDAIFFNCLDSDRQIRSIAMPDLLVDTMRRGVSMLDVAGAAFFIRHDSMGDEHALSVEQNQALKNIIAHYSRTLAESYQQHLQALWHKPSTDLDHHQAFHTTVHSLIAQQREALVREVALCGYSANLSPQEQQRLSVVVEGGPTDGVFSLLCVGTDGIRIPVPSTYIVSEFVQDNEQPTGWVLLIMPDRGIERYHSVDALREALSGPLSDSLRGSLALGDQLQLGVKGAIEPHAWTFEAMEEPLIENHVHAVQDKQMQDCRFLLEQKDVQTDRQTFYAELGRIQTCSHLDEAMGQRFSTWVAKLRDITEPHWRKFADAEKKEYLLRLETDHDERRKEVDRLFGNLYSLEAFARTEIIQYIRRHLGRFIDPDHVRIMFQDNIQLNPDNSLDASYENSLLGCAVGGLPSVAGEIRFSPSPDQLHAEFSTEFVRTMLTELNLHQRYENALEQLVTDEQVLRAMTHHRDSAIALGAFAAKLQGHLLQERSQDLIHLIRGDRPREGAIHSIGCLYLTATESRFRDLIVFKERIDTDEHFVLYAPGTPGGRDFFEFDSWRQLSLEVGKWLATEPGRRYVHDQLSGPSATGVIAALNDVLLKPGLWGPESCRFVRCSGQNFESNLTDLVRRKALSSFAHFNGQARPASDLPSYADTSVLAVVNAQITALNTEFASLSPGLMSLRDYVHDKTSVLLNDFLRRQGYAGHVDPDTVYLGLGVPYSDTPDFSEHSDLQSLTDLMMYGSEDLLSYKPQIHLYSSVGMDVTRFPNTLIAFMSTQIREADLAACYMDFLTNEFLGRKHPLHGRRKALLAKRIQCEMTRDALTAFHRSDLELAQYTWLRHTVVGLSVGAQKNRSIKHTAVSSFRIGNQIIEGVYIFRDFATEDPDYNLLYTPGAPDGRDFRPLTDYARLLESAQMQSYYASRVAHAGQRPFGEFLEELIRGGKNNPDFIRIHNRPENRIANVEQLYGKMFERMIADVDSQTESKAEKRLALAWTIIKWTGTIVLLPFPYASFGWGLLTTTVTFVQAFDAYSAGDRATAIPLFVIGAIGILSGSDATRALIMGGHGLLRIGATKAGIWVWNKLDLSTAYRLPA